MSKPSAAKFMEMDAAAVTALLARTKDQHAPEDHALFEAICDGFIGLQSLVRDERASIARLRRFVGMESSEKTAKVIKRGGGDRQGHGARQRDGKRKAKGHGRISAADYPNAEHVAIAHETLRAKDPCPECETGTLYRMKEPVRFLRIFGQTPLCPVCFDLEQLRCSACGKVFTARPPKQAEGGKFSETAASMMALLRYGAGLPLNRLAHLQRWMSAPVPASTQWDVVLGRVGDVRPAFLELLRRAAQGSVVHNDDTFVRILAFMGERRAKLLRDGKLEDEERTGLFTTAVVAITDIERPIAAFFSGRKHAGENTTALFRDREEGLKAPLLMSDALERNLPDIDVDWANCIAHGRRNVVDQVENYPKECKHILDELGRVFAVDRRAKRKRLSPKQRLLLHQEKSKKVMNRLEAWLRALAAERRIEPNSGMGQAIDYLLKRWPRFCRFLEVPGAPLDNNIVERALKMAIRHRNASLFYKTLRGAKVGDIYMTLIHTAVLNNENPFEYLTALMSNPNAVARSPADWLPWSYRATLARQPSVETTEATSTLH